MSGLIVRCPTCTTANRVPADRLNSGKCGRCGAALFQGEPITLTSSNPTLMRPVATCLFWWTSGRPGADLAARWHQPAASIEPALRLGKLDTEAEQGIAARYGIRSIPTMIPFLHGREIARQYGAMPIAAIVEWARGALPR